MGRARVVAISLVLLLGMAANGPEDAFAFKDHDFKV